MTCRTPVHDPESLVAAYLTGSLRRRRRLTAARHIARCEQCGRELRTLSWIVASIGKIRPDFLDEMSCATAADLLAEVARDRRRGNRRT